MMVCLEGMKSNTDLERLGLFVSLGLTLGDVHRASVYRLSVQFERVQRLKLQTRTHSLLHHSTLLWVYGMKWCRHGCISRNKWVLTNVLSRSLTICSVAMSTR